MARPKAFDRDCALDLATAVFWTKGFAATSTDDLLGAMRIGRQSLYDSFGNKRRLYLEALSQYQQRSLSEHLGRLRSGSSALARLEALLFGLVPDDADQRQKGCMGVNAISEFGVDDQDIAALRARSGTILRDALRACIEDGQRSGELSKALDVEAATAFVATTMQGLQISARAGVEPAVLRGTARLALRALIA